jgi:hypothetical protein
MGIHSVHVPHFMHVSRGTYRGQWRWQTVFNIHPPSYITTIYRRTTLTCAAHSHRRSAHALVGALPLRCYVETHRIDSSDGAVRPSGLCCRWSASHVVRHSALTQCPSSVPRAGRTSARSTSQLVPAAISRLSRKRPQPILQTISAKTVRNGRPLFNEPGPSSLTFRHCAKPSARSSIEANIHWHDHWPAS